jgi:Ala-tRNA(Pro) deacylase
MSNIPQRLTQFLEENKVPYEIVHHDAAFTAQEVAQEEHVKGRNHAKVVMVKSNGDLAMAVLPAHRIVDLEKFESLTHKGASLADEEEFTSLFPDCAVGTMPPLGNLYGVPTYVERSLSRDEFIVFQAGTHTDSIKLSYTDYERLAKPVIADLAVRL